MYTRSESSEACMQLHQYKWSCNRTACVCVGVEQQRGKVKRGKTKLCTETSDWWLNQAALLSAHCIYTVPAHRVHSTHATRIFFFSFLPLFFMFLFASFVFYFHLQSFGDAVLGVEKAKCNRTLMVSIRAIFFHFVRLARHSYSNSSEWWRWCVCVCTESNEVAPRWNCDFYYCVLFSLSLSLLLFSSSTSSP